MTDQFNHPRWGECYYDHFEKFLDKPVGHEGFEQKSSGNKLQIIQYDNIFGGCRAFCSFGLSRYVTAIGEIAEVFMPIDDGWDMVPSILADSLLYMVQQEIHIGWGMTFRFANIFSKFTKKFGKAAIYFSAPFGVPEGFSHVNCGNKIGNIYLACYISEAERQYFLDHGAETFESLLEEKCVDVFHLMRPSLM